VEIIIINGSPRKSGNSSFLCERAISILENQGIKTKYINIRKMNFEPCIACGYCDRTGKCFMKDDMAEIYDIIDKSDGTIAISPVFFDGVPGKLKGFVDRTQAFYASKYILKSPTIDRYKKRYGLLVSLAGSKPYETQFIGNKVTMEFFFKCINTKLVEHMQETDIDNIPIDEREDFLKNFDKNIKEIINLIKSSLC